MTISAQTNTPQTTAARSPSVLDADTAARTLATSGAAIYELTAQRKIDVPGTGATAWDLTQAASIDIYKDNRAVVDGGILIDVTTNGGGLWTTPAGLNQNFVLPGSPDQLCGAWRVLVDGPSRTVRVVTLASGVMEFMHTAPTVGPGDTLDLFAGGTFTGHVITGAGAASYYQTGAPRSDGAAFMALAVANTRSLQDIGDGNGQRLLYEGARANQLLQTETIFTAGAITAPWVAINGNCTGLGQQAGDPAGNATLTNLIFAGNDATTGVKQPLVSGAANLASVGSVFARVSAGTGKFRIQYLLKGGGLATSPDFNLTTTLNRFDFFVPNLGETGDAGTAEFRIINGSDAANRTIQATWAQVENLTGSNGITPTSYIKAVAAQGIRGTDLLIYPMSAVPASFSTRGVVVDVMPGSSSLEAYASRSGNGQNIFAMTLLQFTGGSRNIFYNDDMFVMTSNGEFAGGAWRLAILSSLNNKGNFAVQSPTVRSFSHPIQWPRNARLVCRAEAYRGAVGLDAGSAQTMGGQLQVLAGPWGWPTIGAMILGPRLNGPDISGSYGRFITAA